MKALGSIRATLLTIMLAAAGILGAAGAEAQSPNYLQLSAGDITDSRPVHLGLNKSMVIDLPRAAGDVLVSNPAIADAVLRTSTRLYLIGVQIGQASVFLFDGAGQQIASFDIYVEADLAILNQLLAEAIPDGFVRADAINESIILRGQVASASDAARAAEITGKMLGQIVTSVTDASANLATAAGTSSSTTQSYDLSSLPGVINLLTIAGEDQVALKVTIAEVQRSVVKQLGINLSGILVDGGLTLGSIGGLSPLAFPLNSAKARGQFDIGYEGDNGSIQANLDALEETQMLRTLAEPTLTAVSGETANFLAGGEFPVPVAGADGEITIEFKKFGVQLAFTPVVLSAGRISMKIRTEVSDISANGAVSLPIGNGFTVTIPATTTRQAETSIEVPSGGAFAIAGLIQEDTRRAVSGFPYLQRVPILGALFASKDFLSEQTELVMIVTPYIVKPTSPRELARPDDNLVMADDAEAYLLNRLTKVYGRATEAPGGSASGQVGFTFD
jgi:pilus assembly protein CpaC